MKDKPYQLNLIGIIDVPLVKEAIAKIESIPPDNSSDICLMINSKGGSVPVALTFARYLCSLPRRIVAYNAAHCDSAAIIIFASAQERIALQASSFMFHPPCVNLNGKYTLRALSVEMRRLKEDKKSVITFLSHALSLDKRHLHKWLDRGEFVFDAQQALRMGIATGIEPIL